MFDSKEATKALGLRNAKLFERHVRPQLPCLYVGRVPYFAMADLEAWVEAKRDAACNPTPAPSRRAPASPRQSPEPSRHLPDTPLSRKLEAKRLKALQEPHDKR